MKTTDSGIQSLRNVDLMPLKSYQTDDYCIQSWNTKEWEVGFKIPPTLVENKGKSSRLGENDFIKLSISGKSFLISKQLDDVIEEIKLSSNLLKCEDDWDCQGGLSLDPKLYISTIDFLLLYSEHILKTYNIVIQSPEINLCPNGSLDLSWVTKNARLLINIRNGKDNVLGRFYGYRKSMVDHKITKIEKEGAIDMTTFEESLAVWMKSLV